jgi:hypothetical protein
MQQRRDGAVVVDLVPHEHGKFQAVQIVDALDIEIVDAFGVENFEEIKSSRIPARVIEDRVMFRLRAQRFGKFRDQRPFVRPQALEVRKNANATGKGFPDGKFFVGDGADLPAGRRRPRIKELAHESMMRLCGEELDHFGMDRSRNVYGRLSSR